MGEFESFNHTKWECLYYVVFMPKRRPRTLYVGLRKYLGEMFQRLAEHTVATTPVIPAKAGKRE